MARGSSRRRQWVAALDSSVPGLVIWARASMEAATAAEEAEGVEGGHPVDVVAGAQQVHGEALEAGPAGRLDHGLLALGPVGGALLVLGVHADEEEEDLVAVGVDGQRGGPRAVVRWRRWRPGGRPRR